MGKANTWDSQRTALIEGIRGSSGLYFVAQKSCQGRIEKSRFKRFKVTEMTPCSLAVLCYFMIKSDGQENNCGRRSSKS